MSATVRSRRAAVVVAALLVATSAACGSSHRDPSAAPGTSTTSAPAAAGSSTSGDTGLTVPAGTAAGPDPTAAAPTQPGTPPGATPDSVPAPSGPGSYATRYLRPAGPARITVAALAQPGAEPQPGTLDHLRATLVAASGKPVDVAPGALGGGAASWTTGQLAAAVDAAAPPQSAGTAVLTVLFVHGDLGGDTSILGVAFRGDAAAVFVDQLAASAGLLGSVEPIERSVSTHELGHLLGLVDLVLATGRQDPAHPGHSTNKASVMYWAVESDAISQLLGADPPAELDDADRADLAAIRDGAGGR